MTRKLKIPRLTLFGRSLLLFICEIAANAICWTAAGILFGRSKETRSILSLGLLSWTLGLRHALDADHIRSRWLILPATSAIDNATRGLINQGQLAVTCGLFFSLGHSTIVIVVTVAIAISSSIFDRMYDFGDVGGIIGAAVSGSFLFIIGLANTIILGRIIRRRLQENAAAKRRANGETIPETPYNPQANHSLMMRILGPVVTFVNRPWKMYPVGVLFGLGFDTASSIALLSISALAKRDSNGNPLPSSHIVIFPFLFTAGMTLVDSSDSILMLFSYAGFPENSWKIFTRSPERVDEVAGSNKKVDSSPKQLDEDRNRVGEAEQIKEDVRPAGEKSSVKEEENEKEAIGALDQDEEFENTDVKTSTRVKMNVMSGLSILLTLMSILVAFSISLITIMGLIGEQCKPCSEAADADDGHGGGLAGRWWRAWANANDQSEYIGIAIVGGFLVVVAGWYGARWAMRKVQERKVRVGGPAA